MGCSGASTSVKVASGGLWSEHEHENGGSLPLELDIVKMRILKVGMTSLSVELLVLPRHRTLKHKGKHLYTS